MRTKAFRLAFRELRGGFGGFRVFIACLALGVAAIAAVGGTAEAIRTGLEADGRKMLGGDLSIAAIHRDISPDARGWLEAHAEVSRSVRMRAMARGTAGAAPVLIELKAVDGRYPLYGALRLTGTRPGRPAFARIDGVWGAAVGPRLLRRLGVAPGERIRIGDAAFEIRGAIAGEPDRLGDGGLVGFGPRVLISTESLADTGLIRPGSLVRFRYLVRLARGADPDAWRRALGEAFPDAVWRIRDRRSGSPATGRLVRRAEIFMSLIGLAALLIGGVGIGNAVGHHLGGRMQTIATLKCLGASSRLVFGVYLIQILTMAAIGIGAGLALGVAAPLLAGEAISAALGVFGRFGIYPAALALAAAYGVLTTLLFSLWPLACACRTPGAVLFRDAVVPGRVVPRPLHAAAVAASAALLAGLVLASAGDRRLALWFVGGAAVSFLLFRLIGFSLERGAAAIHRRRTPTLRLALANLHRPGAPTATVVVSMGLSLTALVAIASIEGTLRDRLADSLPARAPDFYFLDLQSDQAARFEDAVRGVARDAELVRVPMLRGRITAINGAPAAGVEIRPSARWLLRGDRGITWSAEPVEGARLVDGPWWPPDYRGPPLVSLSANAAFGLGVALGDSLTVNVLGREITARIANLREVRWRSLRMNFVMVFSPGAFAGAPHMQLATLRAPPGSLHRIERAVTDRFTNVTVIRVTEMLALVEEMVARLGALIRAAAAIALVAGVLVLASAAAAGHRRRVHDAVVLKVLGASRGRILRAYAIEHGLLGLATAAAAAGIGSLVAWAVVRFVMETEWSFQPGIALATAAGATLLTLVFGFLGTWRALGEKAAVVLRNA